jgi:uncharacterized protein
MIRYILPIIMVVCHAGAARAADDLESLRSRMKERYPQLQKLKEAGKIGETWDGYVEAVKDEYKSEVQSLTSSENDDRRKVYRLLAAEEGVSAEEVARNNAVRLFQRAKKGEYLKGPDGKWTQKN